MSETQSSLITWKFSVVFFFVLNKKLCMPSWNLLLFKQVHYSCTTVRFVLMSPLCVCSVYIGVGITLQKSSVYLYTAKNIGIPSLVTHGWHISFLLWAFSVSTFHTHYLCMCTKTYYQNRVLEWLIYCNCFRTVLQSELWT